MEPATELTHGHLLGGRIRYAQPARGFRSGIEPVLLAAAVPARPGQHVLEAGTGAGAGLLCLAARVQGIGGFGLERDPELARIARANLQANGCDAIQIESADVTSWQPRLAFDHVFSNPPWHAENCTPSPDSARDRAKRATAGLPGAWVRGLARALKSRGTLTLILPVSGLAEWMEALSGNDCGAPTLLPLWPRIGRPAKLVLLHAIKGGRGPSRLLAGLVLHADGGFTPAAEAVLRDGQPLSF